MLEPERPSALGKCLLAGTGEEAARPAVPAGCELRHAEEIVGAIVLFVEDVGHLARPQPVRRALDDLDLVTGLELPFGKDPQVDAGAACHTEAFGKPVVSQADPELVTEDARPGDLQAHTSNMSAVADDRLAELETVGRPVLA